MSHLIPSPGMEPPRPAGCPSCAQAEAQCDRMAQQIRQLEADLLFEGRARVQMGEGLNNALAQRDLLLGAINDLLPILEEGADSGMVPLSATVRALAKAKSVLVAQAAAPRISFVQIEEVLDLVQQMGCALQGAFNVLVTNNVDAPMCLEALTRAMDKERALMDQVRAMGPEEVSA